MVSQLRKKYEPLSSQDQKTRKEKRHELLKGLEQTHPEFLSVNMLSMELKALRLENQETESRLDIIKYIRDMHNTKKPIQLHTLSDDFHITEMTKDSDELWHTARYGRITASVCNRIRTRQISLSNKDSSCYRGGDTTSVMQTIMGYGKPKLEVYNLKKGRELEPVALKLYENVNGEKHINMVVTKTGLHIHPKHLYIAATPDSLVTCECCGDGTVEIKCAVSLMQKDYKSWADVAILPNYLYHCGSKIHLKQSSGYYYQVIFTHEFGTYLNVMRLMIHI